MKIGKKELIIKDVEETEVTDDVEKEETEDMDKTSFIRKHWKKILGGAALVGGAIATKVLLSRNTDDDDYDDYDEDLDDEETEGTADDTTEDK